MSHCIINKQMASASSYIICPFPDFNWSIKSLATFGLARQVLIWVQHMKITGRGKVVFIFWVYVKVGNSWKQKYILSLASKWKISARKKIEKISFKYGLHQHLCNEPQTLQPLVLEMQHVPPILKSLNLVTLNHYSFTHS